MCVWIVPELNVREVTRVMCDTNYKRERCTWVVQNDNASVRHLASSGDLTPDVPADPQSATGMKVYWEQKYVPRPKPCLDKNSYKRNVR